MIKSKVYPRLFAPTNQPTATTKFMTLISNYKIIIFCLSIISLLSYLVIVNRTNTMGYEIAEMELRINNLKEQHRDLESKATELQSMQRIKSVSNSVLSMVEAENFDYILPEQTSVAVK
ncbi:hypothetical protein KKF32_01405 [Patescibacteria group bacterium]|nr:hypothetical protein [Patescibacteria group bacterium]